MILTVTLSPCIDKTAECGHFDINEVNRITPVAQDFGGKGINVSRAVKKLGLDTFALGFGFDKCGAIESMLDHEGIQSKFVETSGVLRTNLKILDKSTGNTVEINEPAPTVNAEHLDVLIRGYERLVRQASIVVLAGSVPLGVPKDIYKTLCIKAKLANPRIKIIVDAAGELLTHALEAQPYLIKPNKSELCATFGVKADTEEDVAAVSKDIISKRHARVVLTSMGGKGAMIVTEDEKIFRPAIPVRAKSAQGAGDAMVAGVCRAIAEQKTARDMLLYGIASATGAVTKQGTDFCSAEEFEEYLGRM